MKRLSKQFKNNEFDADIVWRALGYDSPLEPAVKHILEGAHWQFQHDQSKLKDIAELLSTINMKLLSAKKRIKELEKCIQEQGEYIEKQGQK